jgi:uncharacterized protein
MTEYSDRKGDWIITYTGKRFYPLDPRPEDINIEDIAHSLAIINRFTGHSQFPFSVAQHSLHVSGALGWFHHEPENVQLAGLLHDASEAYVNDLSRPLKRMLNDYNYVEQRILDVIDVKFGVTTRTAIVKEADNKALVTEAQRLCAGEDWYNDDHWPSGYGYAIPERDWRLVENEFLHRFKVLNG